MIEFVEKEPFESYDNWNDCKSLLYPNVMIKDGKEYFVKNRREPHEARYHTDIPELMQQLKDNNGTYATFYSNNKEIWAFLDYIIEHHYSFEERFKEFEEHKEGNFTDFHGNLNEISSAFMYRLYDTNFINEIKKVVELIKNKQWEIAKNEVQAKWESSKKIEQEIIEEMEQ